MFVSNFESDERSFKNRKTAIATFVTIGLHALIILFLLWSILSPPTPPFTDRAGGVTVNFGTDDAGTGDIQPMTLTPIEADFTLAAAPNTAQPIASSQEEVVTQDIDEAPVVESNKSETPKPKTDDNALFKPTAKANTGKPITSSTNTNTSANTNPEPKADPNALFTKGAKGTPNNSKGDGTGGGQGDQGKPNGDPNSRNYLGDGDGNGVGHGNGDLSGGYSLKGRNKVALPPPVQCSSKGKVVVAIKVDKTGKVVDAKLKRFESTVFDECNVNNALNAARKSSFTPDANAPDIQEGTITYIYKVN